MDDDVLFARKVAAVLRYEYPHLERMHEEHAHSRQQRQGAPRRYAPSVSAPTVSPPAAHHDLRPVRRALQGVVTAHETRDPGHALMAADMLRDAQHPHAEHLAGQLQEAAEMLRQPPDTAFRQAGHERAHEHLRRVLHEVLHHAARLHGRPGFASRVRPAVDLHDAATDAMREGRHQEAAGHIRRLADAMRSAGIRTLSLHPDDAHAALHRYADAVEGDAVPRGGYVDDLRGEPWWQGHQLFRHLPMATSDSRKNHAEATALLASVPAAERFARRR